MKSKYIYPCLAGALLMAACQPDEYSMGGTPYTAESLVQGLSYDITVEGNQVKLKSNVEGCTPLWQLPTGRSQEKELQIGLPFAGDYQVIFGIQTPSGPVFAEPATVHIQGNDFSLVDSDMWTFLAGGVDAEGNCKEPVKWVPIDKDYGVGRCTGPVLYMSPDDVNNDGAGITDVTFGSANWASNWDPGLPAWLLDGAEQNPYFDSYMQFGLDPAKGCVATMYRGESGVRGSSTGSTMNGTFTFNVDDPKHPVISFSDCFSMHPIGFDAVCNNYTKEVKIIELTPYVLQIATMRTNDEGAWWLVWNFINADVLSGKLTIPTDEELLTSAPAKAPEFENLEQDIFTTDINGVLFSGSELTFLLDDEKPYDWMWWNGASAAWQSVVGEYNTTWCPAPDADGVADFEMILKQTADGYAWESPEGKGKFTINDGKMAFFSEDGMPVEVQLVASQGDVVAVKGHEFQVMACAPGEVLTLGLEAERDAADNVNKYLVANLKYKPLSSQSGPVVLSVDNAKLKGCTYIEGGKWLRLEFFNPWVAKDYPVDTGKLRLKKGQKITIKYKVNGIEWNEGAAPKHSICHNLVDGYKWEADGVFDEADRAMAFNTAAGAENTIVLQNPIEGSAKFDNSCLTVTIQLDGFGSAALTDDGQLNTDVVFAEVTSMTIE